jgi:hypothetical protein
VQTADRRMMWRGMFLFLIGLVTGMQECRFKTRAWRCLRIWRA